MKATLIRWSTRISANKDPGVRPKAAGSRGVALLFALLLLVIMSALGVIMVLTVSPDMMINGYYGNFRGSFYAADSGLNIARQQLMNDTVAAVSPTACTFWGPTGDPGCTSDPLLSFSGKTEMDNVMKKYPDFTKDSLLAGQAAKSWPATFEIADNGNCVNSYLPATGSPVVTAKDANGNPTAYQYSFIYNLCSLGRAQGTQYVVTSEKGAIQVTVQAQTSGSTQQNQNFAAFGYFVNNYPACSAPLVPGTLTGPLVTNGQWQYGTSGSYIFTDTVKQQNANAGYWFNGKCIQSPTSQYTYGGQTIKPTFQQGLSLGETAATVPANDFSQKWAVLDGKGCGEGSNICGGSADPTQNPPPPAVTNADLNSKLKNSAGTAYPSPGGASSGVYMPYSCTGGPPCVKTINGGGIFVEGDALVVLSIGTDGLGNPTQTYTITNNGATTTITTNAAANTTNFNGTVLAGVPQNLSGTSPSAATMLYVDGTITGLRGTSASAYAVNDGVAVTITAAKDVDITGNLLYKTQPVTHDSSDALTSGGDKNQVLGVFTDGGNIVLSTPYSVKNLEVDASVAALGKNGTWSTASHIDTLTIVGGRITSNISGIDVSTRNVFFDRRFLSRKDGFAPPWFPSTVITTTGTISPLPPLVCPSSNAACKGGPPPQRLSWVTAPQ